MYTDYIISCGLFKVCYYFKQQFSSPMQESPISDVQFSALQLLPIVKIFMNDFFLLFFSTEQSPYLANVYFAPYITNIKIMPYSHAKFNSEGF